MATHDELTSLHVGSIVHVVVDGECCDAVVDECDPMAEAVSRIGLQGVGPSWFDRAGEFEGSWHYADHGEWRDE